MRHTSGSDSIAPVSDHGNFSEPSSSQLEGHTCNVTLSSSILGPLESSGCSFGSLVHEDRDREQFMNNTVPQNYKQPKTKKPWRPRQGEELLKHAEAQKKYREKKKQMKEYLETRMKACNEERLALMVQNEQLRGQIYASERLVQYATSMANTLRSWTCSVMEGYQYLEKKALHASRVFKLLSKAVQRRILNAVRSSMDASTFGEMARTFVIDPSIFEDIRSLLLLDAARLMVDWSNKASKRTSIEAELKEYQTLAIEFHRPTPKTFFTIPQTIRTKLINQIKKECGEAFKNEDLVRAIQVTHEQREAMLDAWYAYTARYAQYIRSQLATLRLIDVPASSSSSSSSWTRHCLQDQAIDHLGACDKVSHLERIVNEEYQARFDLVLQTVKILSPLQSLYIRLSTLYSCDIRVSYGIILGLDFDKCEALMEVGHPTISECQALSCALRSLSSVSTISSLSKEKDEKRIT